jgi:hypothetical protein
VETGLVSMWRDDRGRGDHCRFASSEYRSMINSKQRTHRRNTSGGASWFCWRGADCIEAAEGKPWSLVLGRILRNLRVRS